jgi:DNA polymerase-3 subunit beta
MAATDSYRLAVKETEVAGALPELDAIIPARALQELARIAAGADELQLGMLENHVVFGADGTWLTTRRIDGQFPNYRQLLPEQFERFNADFLRDGLESVDSESIRFKLISPLRPAVLEGDSDDYVYLIMPIRLAG